MGKHLGFVALIGTVILNATALIFLRHVSQSPSEGFFILAAGYAVVTSLLVHPHCRTSLKEARSGRSWIGLWAASIICIYVLFLSAPGAISLSQLIIAQSVVPIVAVFAAGDLRPHRGRKESFARILPLAILLVLAKLRANPNSSGSLLAFVALCICFLGSQTSMRRVARSLHPRAAIPALGVICMVLLTGLTLITSHGIPRITHLSEAYGALLAGPAILGVQFGYLFGIKHTPPILSALAISMAVPAAMGLEWAINGRAIGTWDGLLSFFYCASVVGLAALESRTALRSPASFSPDDGEQRAA